MTEDETSGTGSGIAITETISPESGGTPMTEEEILETFDNTIDSPFSSMAEFFSQGPIMLIVNDRDRSTPTAEILGYMDKYLRQKTDKGLADHDITAMIATGTHAPPDEDGIKIIFGDFYDHLKSKDKIMLHFAKDEDAHELVLTTSRGTPINVDKRVKDFKRIININSVEPHYFAGYTGVRKSFLPGVSSWETVEKNHLLAMAEESATLSLKGNPVHDDMIDAVNGIINELGLEVLSIHLTFIPEGICSFTVGHIDTAMNPVVEAVNKIFCAPVSGMFDIVIARTSAPQNQKLYQALKSFENGKLAVRKGGILIMEATCEKGIGPENFYKVVCSSDDPLEIIENVRKNYTLGAHKTTNLLDFLREHKVYMVSQLDDEVIQNCFCEPFPTVEDALAAAAKDLGLETPKVLEIIEANNLVPIVEKRPTSG